MVIGLTDTVFIGQTGAVPLAAASLANTAISFFLVFGIGVVSSVAIRASHRHGEGRSSESGEILRHGLLLSLGIGALMAVLLELSPPLLIWLGQPRDVVATTLPYLGWVAWSLPAAFVSVTIRNYAEAHGHPWAPFWILGGTVILNIVLNWALIFGNLGCPAFGLEGSGLATFIARAVGAVVLGWWMMRSEDFRHRLPAEWWTEWKPEHLQELLTVGLPVGAQIVAEIGAFGCAGLMMGWIGANALAAHQIAISCAATTFMFPLGLSLALTLRVGHCRGSGNAGAIPAIVAGGYGSATLVMGLFSCLFIGAGGRVAGIFTNDAEAVALAAQMLLVAGVFQIVDGWQVLGIGVLRGFSDVRFIMVAAGSCYFGVCLPLAWALGFCTRWGATGIWIGLASGLSIVAALLGWRVWRKISLCLRETAPGHGGEDARA